MDEVELYFNLINYRNLTESYIDNIDFKSQLEQQIQNQETKNDGWRFPEIGSMTTCF